MRVSIRRITEGGSWYHVNVQCESLPRLAEQLAPEGSTLEARLNLSRCGEGVLVQGSLEGTLQVPCHRCLEPIPLRVAEDLALTLVPESRINAMEDGLQLTPEDLSISFFQGEHVDLTHLVEDEALLLVPEVVCEEDEAGRCLCCGRDVAEVVGEEREPLAGHPFAQLKSLLKD